MKQHSSYGDPARFLTHLHVAADCLDLPYTREIIARARLPVTVVDERGAPEIAGEYPYNLTAGKRHLLLCRNRGAFFKPCPGTREYRCCDYQVLNITSEDGAHSMAQTWILGLAKKRILSKDSLMDGLLELFCGIDDFCQSFMPN